MPMNTHELGSRVRGRIDNVISTIGPYVKMIIPSFKAAHYVYVILWTIIGSIFIYPVKNMKYIDALFFGAGASTQSGLNTVDVNEIDLWQQMVLYIIATLTTPIFIHGSLLFVRLWSFERYFDGIKESSKLNHKMRRTATLARARTNETLFNTRANTDYNLHIGEGGGEGAGAGPGDGPGPDIPMVLLPGERHPGDRNPKVESVDPMDLSPSSSSPKTGTSLDPEVNHISEPSDEEPRSPEGEPQGEEPRRHIQFGTLNTPQRNPVSSPSSPRPGEELGIRFGALPMPQRRNHEIDPSEMYRSIELLQNNKNNNEDDDDVLIIKPPNEIENDDETNPIFTRKGNRQFEHTKLGKKLKSRVRKRLKKMRTMSMNSIEDENESIDSDDEDGTRSFRITGKIRENATTDEDGDEDGDGDDDGDDEDDEDGDDSDYDLSGSEKHVRQVTSNLALPSSDQTGGKKFTKRANTFDASAAADNTTKTKKPSLRRRLSNSVSRAASTDEEASLFTTGTRSMSRNLSNQLTRLRTANYLSWEPTIGRNSNFVHLTDEQKEELGGVEYRAIKLLIKIVWLYYLGLHLVSIFVHLGWILNQPSYRENLRGYGLAPVWWAFFTAQTSFNDLGYTLTPNSMIDFNNSVYVMLWGTFFIVAGNTGFPVFLRFIIWVLYKFAKPMSLFEESLGFLLDHPRRCFTLLFPSGATWLLFAILIVLNVIDWILFIILDLNNEYLELIPTGYRVVCGFYNAITTRTAGLTTIDLSQLHTAVQVSYMIMMYISVMPIAISIRRTNVYEEQSLGIYIKDDKLNMSEDDEKSPTNFIGNHLRNQLSFDLWFVFLGLFIICICENSKLEDEDVRFTAFTILFECVSAYGTVGLSLGYPDFNASLCKRFTVISKLVIIAMMIRGRHRGLPYSLDRAIMLPDDNMMKRDQVQENHAIRRHETLERSHTEGNSTTGHDLYQALSRRGNEVLRRRRSTVNSRG